MRNWIVFMWRNFNSYLMVSIAGIMRIGVGFSAGRYRICSLGCDIVQAEYLRKSFLFLSGARPSGQNRLRRTGLSACDRCLCHRFFILQHTDSEGKIRIIESGGTRCGLYRNYPDCDTLKQKRSDSVMYWQKNFEALLTGNSHICKCLNRNKHDFERRQTPEI